jgi:hypothetical protein
VVVRIDLKVDAIYPRLSRLFHRPYTSLDSVWVTGHTASGQKKHVAPANIEGPGQVGGIEAT